VRQLTERLRCRIEDGIFFSNGEVILLQRAPDKGYAARGRTTVEQLEASDPDGWVDLDPSAVVEREGLVVAVGGGPLEGEGFVAVAENGQVIWILHLASSEAFSAVRLEGDCIVAVTDEYPYRAEWRIPLADPAAMLVSSRHV